ncbi:MAG: hypothetical protein JSV93_02760 [Candidatus Omnitrophota bacterium]|nr:MAG: hypothetical protein JSV93_02760 [Candidatus Omnitrophota bacterium]
MLLYIYLRGLYCRFQKPIFTWYDKKILKHLSISQSTLSRSRKHLQKQGMLKFRSGIGTSPTEYTMLGTVLLPVVKKTTRSRQNHTYRYRRNDDTLLSIKEREKKKIEIRKLFIRYDPYCKESIREKNRLKEMLGKKAGYSS